jgi:hypothetical protein
MKIIAIHGSKRSQTVFIGRLLGWRPASLFYARSPQTPIFFPGRGSSVPPTGLRQSPNPCGAAASFAQALWIIGRQCKRTARLAPISPFFAFFSTGEIVSIKTASRRRNPGIVGITLLARPQRVTRDRLLNR